MGTLNRAFQRIKRWLTTPGKTFGTGWAPTRRQSDDPVIVMRSNRSRRIDNSAERSVVLKIARWRKANKQARRSRRINQLRAA